MGIYVTNYQLRMVRTYLFFPQHVWRSIPYFETILFQGQYGHMSNVYTVVHPESNSFNLVYIFMACDI
jgi:hypothetical protein